MPEGLAQALMPVSQAYGLDEIVVNLTVAILLGLLIAIVYRVSHHGLSYSQSFTHTIVFLAPIVAIVMMVIGNSLSRAFALVGALSIIRFRTVVKDTKDTAYVFMALAAGMAAGTSSHLLGAAGTLAFVLLAGFLRKTDFGSIYKSDFLLRFVLDRDSSGSDPVAILDRHARRSNLLHMEPSADGRFLRVAYDVTMRHDGSSEELSRSVAALPGVSEVTLIASKRDIEY